MSPHEFIKKIITVYQDARVSKFADEKIRRGRSHSISSISEDLFASYLILNDKNIDLVYVDQPMRVPDVINRFIPDIVVVKDSRIVAFIDLKMDLGYKRTGLINLCAKNQVLLESIRGSSCIINDGLTKEKQAFSISSDAIYDVVIVSNQNISKALLAKQLSGVKVHSPAVKVHILSSNEHPNTYGYEPNQLIEKITVHEEAFKDVINRIE